MDTQETEIYWDTQDSQNPGWAYRSGDESGAIDTLDDLLSVLRDCDTEDDILVYRKDGTIVGGMDCLPKFGGVEPEETNEVWSWDAKRLLVGTCTDDLLIVARKQTTIEIDDELIWALSAEAGDAGDTEQVELCQKALAGDDSARAACDEVIQSAIDAR